MFHIYDTAVCACLNSVWSRGEDAPSSENVGDSPVRGLFEYEKDC